MSMTYAKGDTVRVVTNMKVLRQNTDGSYELNGVDEDGVDAYADYIPANRLSLIRRAQPAEPPVGSFIEYRGVLSSTSVWRRDSDGWHLINPRSVDGLALQWSAFVHTRVFPLIKADQPVS